MGDDDPLGTPGDHPLGRRADGPTTANEGELHVEGRAAIGGAADPQQPAVEPAAHPTEFENSRSGR
jgi:hypothetical protein